jgi:hypothetical protein
MTVVVVSYVFVFTHYTLTCCNAFPRETTGACPAFSYAFAIMCGVVVIVCFYSLHTHMLQRYPRVDNTLLHQFYTQHLTPIYAPLSNNSRGAALHCLPRGLTLAASNTNTHMRSRIHTFFRRDAPLSDNGRDVALRCLARGHRTHFYAILHTNTYTPKTYRDAPLSDNGRGVALRCLPRGHRRRPHTLTQFYTLTHIHLKHTEMLL